ncbi:hypothetical protein [Kordia jejudonensis]|uniref:hypothetical protein n=1 Tax=Kordia jejudonensis TaxID=1348245 RepID=UPI00062908A1|nr:hypothetical protein [Kordia jejudonensis]
MKKVVFIVSLLFNFTLSAQNASEPIVHTFNEIINYVPKNFQTDTIDKPENNRIETQLITIVNLKLYYVYKKRKNASTDEIQWLDERIEKLATGLFLDGKRILIGQYGGASGCPTDKLIDTIQLKNTTITNLNFCYTCTEPNIDDDFIEVFNTKMYHLMKITPPDGKTFWFYGTYKGKAKKRSKIKLIITDERKFKFWIYKKHHSTDYTEGFWKNKNDTLILNSKKLNKTDSIEHILSNANWIEFNDKKFILKRNKLLDLTRNKWKLKRMQ